MNKYNELKFITPTNNCNKINFAINIPIDISLNNIQKFIIKSRNQNHKNIINDFDFMSKSKIKESNNNIKSNSLDEKQINYYNLSTKKYTKSLNLIFNSQIEAINTQFINYRQFINKKKHVYESFINSSHSLYDLNGKRNTKEKHINKRNNIYFSSINLKRNNISTLYKNGKLRNFSAINFRPKNYKEKQILKLEKIFAILKKKLYSHKQFFFKNILYYVKRNDNLPNVNKCREYKICHESNIYIDNKINTYKIKNCNSLIKEKKNMKIK